MNGVLVCMFECRKDYTICYRLRHRGMIKGLRYSPLHVTEFCGEMQGKFKVGLARLINHKKATCVISNFAFVTGVGSFSELHTDKVLGYSTGTKHCAVCEAVVRNDSA